MQRMKLDERRIDALIEGIKQVADSDDPIGKTLNRTEICQVLSPSACHHCWRVVNVLAVLCCGLSRSGNCPQDHRPLMRIQVSTSVTMRWLQDLLLEKVTVPLGVVLCIFEARPDVVPQLVALAIRSGNGLLLKGSEEVQNSIYLLLSILCTALAPYGCSSLVGLIQSREVRPSSLLAECVLGFELVVVRDHVRDPLMRWRWCWCTQSVVEVGGWSAGCR